MVKKSVAVTDIINFSKWIVFYWRTQYTLSLSSGRFLVTNRQHLSSDDLLTWLRASTKMIVGRELGLLSTPHVNCAAVSTLDGNDDS